MRASLFAVLMTVLAFAPRATEAQDFTLPATYEEPALNQGFLPDPYSVSLTAGGSLAPAIEGCAYGYVADAPDVKFSYSTNGGSDLFFYVDSDSDTTLLINTPMGEWICDDDGYFNQNPIVMMAGADAGRYDIWVGTYGEDVAGATLHISEIDPRGGEDPYYDESNGVSPDFAYDGEYPDPSLEANYEEVNLDAGFLPDPYEVSVTAGGSLPVAVGGCGYGYVSSAPDVKLYYTTSGVNTLYLYAEANEDTTLLINTPSGEWICDDDGGAVGTDPLLEIMNAPGGRYDIWIGSYDETLDEAVLYISEFDPR